MRRGSKIGLGILGLAVVVVPLLAPRPVDELAWIRKFGGKQTSYKAFEWHPKKITYLATFEFDRVPPALIDYVRSGRELYKSFGTDVEAHKMPDGQFVFLNPNRNTVRLEWTRDKSWLQQRWDGLQTVLGIREKLDH